MKILILLSLCLTLPSCITLSGQLTLPGTGQPGSLGGSIGGSWTWPTTPALPVDAGAPGKNPVLPAP